MPSLSSPRPISVAEQSIPLDHSPRILRRSMAMPLGMVVPSVASGIRSPAAMLKAPQHDLQRLAVAGVDVDQLDPVGVGMGLGLQHPGHDDAVQPLAEPHPLLDRRAEVVQRLGQHVDVVGQIRRELPHPGQEHLHQNCSRKRMSDVTNSRRSSTS